jgi:hypothetical protein
VITRPWQGAALGGLLSTFGIVSPALAQDDTLIMVQPQDAAAAVEKERDAVSSHDMPGTVTAIQQQQADAEAQALAEAAAAQAQAQAVAKRAKAQQDDGDARKRATEGGTRSKITAGFGIEAGRNLDLNPGAKDNNARLNGTLGYVYEMRTRQTQLSFDARIQPQTDDNHNNGLYPRLGLNWQYEASRTRFNFGASYGEARVTDQSLGFDENTGAIIEYDGTGTRVMKQATAGIEGGLDMPLGYTVQASRNDVDYRDMSASSSQAPSTSTTVKAGLRADVSSMTKLNLDLSHNRYTADNVDQVRRNTDGVTLGVTQRVDAITALQASIGRQRVETHRLGRATDTESGMVFGLGVTRNDTLGSYGLNYGRTIAESGARDTLTFNRDQQTRLGSFSAALGASRGDSKDVDWIGKLAYVAELPRDRLSASLSRAVQSDNNGDDVVVTRLSGNVQHALSEVNSLDFGLMASASEYPTRDSSRLDATMSYQHMLTQDVSLEAGVRLGLAQQSRREDAESQSLFLNLTRQFEFLH